MGFVVHAIHDRASQERRPLGGRRLLVVDIEDVARGSVRTTAIASWAHDVVIYSLEIEGEGIEHRFDDLALVSGDGIFTDVIARLGPYGIKVTVAAWPESLSKRLRLAAAKIVHLAGCHATARRRVAR